MEFYLAHIGINPENRNEMVEMIRILDVFFPQSSILETPLSWFMANGKIELMKEPGYGKKGHLAFYASDIHEAMNMLEAKGFAFDMKSAKYDDDGSLRLIYINREVNGFAIHLTTRQ